MSRQLPARAHTSQRWRIHEIAPDFELEDVWRVRTPGARVGDFDAAVAAVLGEGGRPSGEGRAGRLLFALRWKLGDLFGWDRPELGLGTWSSRLADRVAGVPDPAVTRSPGHPFSPVYRSSRELASEMANATAHAVMHLGWVRGHDGDYELHVAVLVKPRGRAGKLYMRLITPFRLLLVWPSMIAAWERRWLERDGVLGGRVIAARSPNPLGLTIVPDYLDAFTITTDVTASPREWMTACFEEGVERSARDLIFERLLSFHTEPDGSPGTVAGWRIAREDDRSLTVAATGPRVEGNLVVERVGSGTRLTTAIRYRSLLGRLLWEQLSQVHRRQAPVVLRTGAAILRRRS